MTFNVLMKTLNPTHSDLRFAQISTGCMDANPLFHSFVALQVLRSTRPHLRMEWDPEHGTGTNHCQNCEVYHTPVRERRRVLISPS